MAINKKKFKRLCLLAEAYEIELEEVNDLDAEYEKEFSRDFLLESQFASESQKKGEQSKAFIRDTPQKKITEGPVKTLHRALARKTHPDLTGTDEKFKLIQEAYESGDINKLIVEARGLELEIDFTEEDLVSLEEHLANQRSQIHDIKKTVRWAWALSDKSDEMRLQIHQSLGIDSKKFLFWKRKKEELNV